MKSSAAYILKFALLLSLVCSMSCQREDNLSVGVSDGHDSFAGEPVTLSFHTPDSLTRTHWNGNTIEWSAGDRIGVCYSEGALWSKSIYMSEALDEDSAKARFTAQVSKPQTSDDLLFFGVSPSSCLADDFADASGLTVSLPEWQKPSVTSYDKAADIMCARSIYSYDEIPSESIPLLWKRLVAHADITLTSLEIPSDEAVRYLHLTAGSNVILSGEFALDLKAQSLQAVSGSGRLVLDVSDLPLDDGRLRVWACLMPAEISSLEVELVTSKAVYRRQIPSCSLQMGVNRRNILSIDMSSAERLSRVDGSLVRTVHPRMFITADDLPGIRTNAQGAAGKHYTAMKKRVDDLMTAGISFPDPLAASGEYNTNHEIGFRASDAAMVWLISGDRTYLEYAKTILRETIDYYQLRVDNNLNIAWYVYSQIAALCAYDWLYNDLTAAERESFGTDLYNVMYDIAWHGSGVRASRYRENISDHTSGVYGITALPWYLSLVFYGEGINDEKCAQMFRSGYEFHQKMASYRREMAGEKGGGASACAVYSFGFYPLADFNFLHTYRSATGVDLSMEMDYVLKYMDYLDWVRLPDPEKTGSAKEFGFGDVHHSNCRLPYQDINYHICEIVNIYGRIQPHIMSQASEMLSQFSVGRSVDRFPFIRLMHTLQPESVSAPASQTIKSKYFDTMGQVYMRTGTGEGDTYALFVSGGVPTNHKHYDNNNFIIYKHGYRALDSGTRPEPGQHLSHYFARTVAHNCVTVRMPGETFPKYWGNAAPDEEVLPVPNDGGQNQLLASVLKTHIETDDYVYLASDATGSYNSAKASLVMREFVWCVPDLFIVFDRVNSTDAAYPKTWLYHTAAEPVIDGLEFSETSQGGKSICRTLFPSDAVLEKIGGPGKQFWSDGRNWPLPAEKGTAVPDDDWPMVGQWRMEVRPGEARTEDVFMHMIQVGDESLAALPQTETFETDAEIGVTFIYDGKSWRLAFDKSGTYGCNITVN